MKCTKTVNVGWFYDETWRQNIYLLWPVLSASDFTKFIRRQFRQVYEGIDGFDGRCLNVPTRNGFQIVIGVRSVKLTPEAISTLAHECFHAAEYILEARCVPHSEATSEVYAYLTDSIVRRCLRVIAGEEP